MTQKEVLKRIKGLDDATARDVVCALIGHSQIIDVCFGQATCARCEAVVGDTLLSGRGYPDAVVRHHDCAECRANFEKLTWRDKLLINMDTVFSKEETA